jgi:hypothetical protein
MGMRPRPAEIERLEIFASELPCLRLKPLNPTAQRIPVAHRKPKRGLAPHAGKEVDFRRKCPKPALSAA